MNLLKNQSQFIKDFILQSIVFFLVLMIPTVYVSSRPNESGGFIGEYFIEDLIDSVLNSDKPIYISLFYYPIIFFIGSLSISFFSSIFNIYIVCYNKFRKNKEDNIAFKIVILFAGNTIYIIWLSLGNGSYIYYLYGVPIMLTSIFYLIFRRKYMTTI